MTVPNFHLLINGLSVGSGGGYTVARELMRHIALERPGWTVTTALIKGDRLHDEMQNEALPGNCRFTWAPEAAAGQLARARYEGGELVRWAAANGADAVLQLNGMIVPKLKLPTLAHFQDPMPYRRVAWSGRAAPLIAYLKRRGNRRALRCADATGFTSGYLRDLICGYHRVTPRHAEVFYNGIPEAWIERAARELPPWETRPMRVVTVSNVAGYKRQDLVIRALPRLLERAELAALEYRVIGHCPPRLRQHLESLAAELGVGDHVVIEGRVGDDRVREALTSSRCYVLMSLCESFGIPAIEAMSFGTPVVTSDCCAMPEVCGDAAQRVPVDDVEALADRLAAVLADAGLAERMRAAGAGQIRRFNWRDTAAKMAERLEDIAA